MLEVLVVASDFDIRRAFKVMTPITECFNNGKEFLIIDGVMRLSFSKFARKEGNGVPSIRMQL